MIKQSQGAIIKITLKWIGWTSLFATAYFLAAWLGLSLATINESVSPVWPATGIAISILFLRGSKYWPAVAIGAFFVNLTTGNSVFPVLVITIGNIFEALCGAYILNQVLSAKDRFAPHSRTIGIVSAALLGSLISATIGTLTLSTFNLSPWNQFISIWFTWWVADSLGAIIVIPLLLHFFEPKIKMKNKSVINWGSALLLVGSGVLLSYFLFIRPSGAPYLFFIFPLLLWCVNVFGERGVVLATTLLCFVGILSVQLGFGVFIYGTNNTNLINLQLFLASAGVCSLIMTDLKKISSLKKPAVTLLLSWLVAGVLFFGFYSRMLKESDKHFKLITDGVEPMLDARIKLYFSALQSGRALFSASEKVTKSEWKSFLQHGHLRHSLPGVTGMGVIFRISKDKLPTFIKEIRTNQILDFHYHPLEGGDLIGTKYREAYVVTFIEPHIGNEKKVGLDMASETIRKSAADLARDLGEPTLTGIIQLVDDAVERPAFVAYFPFYQNEGAADSVYERRKSHIGWIYSPIYSKEFFQSVFSLGHFKELSYAVYESGQNSAKPISASLDFAKLPGTNEIRKEIKIGNRSFLFRFKRSSTFFSGQDNFTSWVGAIAAVISLLLGTFVVSLQTIKQRAIDLANRKTEDLKANEELWKFALKGAGNGVWDLSIPQNKVKFTKEFIQYLGYDESKTEELGNTWERLVHADDLADVKSQLQNHFEGRANFSADNRLLCKDGNYRWFQARGSIVSWSDEGVPLRMVGTITDITDRKAAEVALNAQRQKLVAAAKMSSLGEMAGGIAHEINNPLAIILGKASQLKRRVQLTEQIGVARDESRHDELMDGLSTIEKTTKRIGAIVKGLSSFSRNAENDSMEKILVPILILDTLELSKERFKFHSIDLRYDLSACEKTYVNGRASELLQVLLNLLNNAYDAVEFLPEKWVNIHTEKTESHCRIVVTDSGPGIPLAIVEKIMTPFFSTKSPGKGTGLGLSISKGIVEDHQGRFYYDYDCKNTCFIIELPLIENDLSS